MEKGIGILLPLASLPSHYSIGSMGKEAREFIDVLAKNSIRYWQVLPLNPTGYGDSPYQSYSAFALNPYFIDLQSLCDDGLLSSQELSTELDSSARIDYSRLFRTRHVILRKAYEKAKIKKPQFMLGAEKEYMREYAAFMTNKVRYNYAPFHEWDKCDVEMGKDGIEAIENAHSDEFGFWIFVQKCANAQWQSLRSYANERNVEIIGDLPIYTALDSCDVWLNKELFKLDKNAFPREVAGVPPDAFSDSGQLWGNPLYNYSRMKKNGYKWWTKRIERAFELYSAFRIDHFRGFDRYYAIPYKSQDAKNGQWRRGAGYELFRRIKNDAIIAEDLGLIDDGVKNLLKKTGYAGMKVLQFAFFGDENNPYLVSNHTENFVAYTGTHDNETTVGFLLTRIQKDGQRFIDEVNNELKKAGIEPSKFSDSAEQIAFKLIKLLLSSRAKIKILPLADMLFLDNSARINHPSTLSELNWSYRFTHEDIQKLNENAKRILL